MGRVVGTYLPYDMSTVHNSTNWPAETVSYANDTLTRNQHWKPVSVCRCDMQFATEFFWYWSPVTNKTMRYFCAGLWYRVSSTSFRHWFLVCVSLALWKSGVNSTWTSFVDLSGATAAHLIVCTACIHDKAIFSRNCNWHWLSVMETCIFQ